MRSGRFFPLALLALVILLAAGGRRVFFHRAVAAAEGSRRTGGAGGRTLTLTFWNVEWFPGQKPDAGERAKAAHVAAVVPVVERLGPDVLGLEEVADADAARLITEHLKGFRVDVCTEFTRGPDNEPSRQQTVLCSRLPRLAGGWENWKPAANGLQPRRGFAYAAYQPAPGEILLVYGIHLKSNLPDEPGGVATNIAMREESGRQLMAHERALAARYAGEGLVRLAVVGGDMNTSLDDPHFAVEQTLRGWTETGGFRWGWAGVPLARRYTLPGEGRYPATCFDHVFYRVGDGDGGGAGAGGVRLVDCVLEGTDKTASDHRPVTARFVW